MDWARAKSILIAVLLLLNIFLLVTIGFYKSGQGISRETISNTVEILEDRGVTVQGEIPLYKRDIPALIYENGSLDRVTAAQKLLGKDYTPPAEIKDGESLVSGTKKLVFRSGNTFAYSDESPSDIVKIEDIDSVERYLRKFLNGLGFQASAYRLDQYVENPDGSYILNFIGKYKKFLIFNNSIKAVVTKNGITYLEGRYRKVKGFSTRSMPIMPAYQILLKNFSRDEKVTITRIDIGFTGFIKEEQNMQEFSEGPAWRIITSDGKPRYFKATDGEEIN